MKRTVIFSLVVTLLVAAWVAWWFYYHQARPKLNSQNTVRAPAVSTTSPTPTPPVASPTPVPADVPLFTATAKGSVRPLSRQERDYLGEFRRPIDFYGVVLDEVSRTPVAGAQVFLSPLDDPNARAPSEYRRVSDQEGRFELTGAQGHDLHVKVSKAGYYQTKLSEGLFTHGATVPSVGERPLTPDPSAPAALYLHKMGRPAALIFLNDDIERVPRDGTPVNYSLASAHTVPTSRGDTISVECWTDDAHKDENLRYDWRCRVSVPSGGLVARTGEFDFVAPEAGYVSSIEFDMPKNARNWSDRARGNYFVQLADGTFARMDFQMIAAGGHFLTNTSYLNPTPGDRNLEYDGALRVKRRGY